MEQFKELPQNREYQYFPRPPASTRNPPIERHEFAMHLNACDEVCRWKLFRSCTLRLDGRDTIECIPKRPTQFDTEIISPGSNRFARDLETRYEIPAVYVAFCHLLILAFPFGFWGWWQATHPGVLQNASVPVTVVLAMLSPFWVRTASWPRNNRCRR